MRKVKVALIGMNMYSHSSPIYNLLSKLEAYYEIAGYVLPEGEREAYPHKLRYLEGLPELTMEKVLTDESIEAVLIETDEIHLTKYALLAAKHNKHIHMEKPGGVSLSDFRELIATMKQTGKVFHVGYMYRYNPVIRQAIEQARAGGLGQIISVEVQMNCPHDPAARQWLERFPGGMMFFLGCHLVDLVLQIQGQPKRITPYNCSTGADGVTAKDFGMAVLEYENGVSFVKTNACEPGGFVRRQLVITGTEKTLELKPLEVMEGQLHHTNMTCYAQYEDWHDKGIFTEGTPFGRYTDMMISFAKYVAGEKENPYTPDYELCLFETILKCCGGEA